MLVRRPSPFSMPKFTVQRHMVLDDGLLGDNVPRFDDLTVEPFQAPLKRTAVRGRATRTSSAGWTHRIARPKPPLTGPILLRPSGRILLYH